MIMTEVEIKAAAAPMTLEEIRIKAEGAGFEESAILKETDVYFNAPDRNFMKTDEALRLRTYEDLAAGTSKTAVTYKGPKTDSRSNTRTEFETGVEDFTTMHSLLTSLGYVPMFTVSKTRAELSKDGVTLCLDRVKNLGDFIELEALTEDENKKEETVEKLLGLLDSLNVSRENLTRKSYLKMLVSKSR